MARADEVLNHSLTSYIPPWEIDANGHWNTQFYLRAFQNATDLLSAGSSSEPCAARPVVDHIRFFRELRVLDTLDIHSAKIAGVAESYRIAHLMRHGSTGELCACLYTTALPSKRNLALLPPAQKTKTGPRSLSAGPHEAADTVGMLRHGRASVTHLGVLRPTDLDHRGDLLAHAVHARVSEGTGHLWEFMGLRPTDFRENGLGRANVEMKVTRHASAPAGHAVRLVSWLEVLEERTVHLRHRLEDLLSGKPLADISAITLLLDMKTRRSAQVPEFMRLKLAGLGRRVPAA